MFDDGGDEIRVGVIGGVEHAEDGVVVGFGTTAGENNFLGMRVDQRGDLFASGFGGGAGFLASGVDGCGVSELPGEEREHGFEDGGGDWRGGVVVDKKGGWHGGLGSKEDDLW